MPPRNIGPRAEYRQQESQRARNSASIAHKFPQLVALTVDLAYSNAEGSGQPNTIKYRANIDNARSVFRFDCPNSECVGGDFDLSNDLIRAYVEHKATLVGEARCQGWRSKTTIGTCRCEHILRYRLSLAYGPAAAPVLIDAAPGVTAPLEASGGG